MKKRHGKVDVKGWNLDAFMAASGAVEKAVADAASEALELAMADEMTGISFPAIYGDTDGFRSGKPVKDPLTVYLHLALSNHPDGVVYSLQIRDDLESVIQMCREDGSYAEGLARLSKAFRELADEIDSALP
jgi:hypothetical protein